MITATNTFQIVDNSPYCVVILTYDSDNTALLEDVLELSRAMEQYFVERCEVGFLDFAYPSNRVSFEKFYSDMPSLMIRRARAHHKMFNYQTKKDLHRTSKLIAMDSKYWGQVIPYENLVNDPVGSFELADREYEKMSDGHKITIMYQTKSKNTQDENTTNRKWTMIKGRDIYIKLFGDILKEMHEHAVEQVEPEMSHFQSDDKIHNQLAIQYFNEQLDTQIASTDIQKELEKRYELMALAEKQKRTDARVNTLLDPVLDPPIQLLPINKPNLELLIPLWNAKRSEL